METRHPFETSLYFDISSKCLKVVKEKLEYLKNLNEDTFSDINVDLLFKVETFWGISPVLSIKKQILLKKAMKENKNVLMCNILYGYIFCLS